MDHVTAVLAVAFVECLDIVIVIHIRVGLIRRSEQREISCTGFYLAIHPREPHRRLYT